MPLYEYECATCHRRTEKIQKFSDPEITVCPHCSGHLERVISAPAIAFKGGGWYADGYGNAKPRSTGDSASNGSGASNSEAKSSNGSSGGDSKSSSSETKSSASNGSSNSNGSTPAPAAAPATASSSSDKK